MDKWTYRVQTRVVQGRMYMAFLPSSWHLTFKALGISQVIGVRRVPFVILNKPCYS